MEWNQRFYYVSCWSIDYRYKECILHVTFYLETLWNNLVEIGKNVFEILKMLYLRRFCLLPP